MRIDTDSVKKAARRLLQPCPLAWLFPFFRMFATDGAGEAPSLSHGLPAGSEYRILPAAYPCGATTQQTADQKSAEARLLARLASARLGCRYQDFTTDSPGGRVA